MHMEASPSRLIPVSSSGQRGSSLISNFQRSGDWHDVNTSDRKAILSGRELPLKNAQEVRQNGMGRTGTLLKAILRLLVLTILLVPPMAMFPAGSLPHTPTGTPLLRAFFSGRSARASGS